MYWFKIFILVSISIVYIILIVILLSHQDKNQEPIKCEVPYIQEVPQVNKTT